MVCVAIMMDPLSLFNSWSSPALQLLTLSTPFSSTLGSSPCSFRLLNLPSQFNSWILPHSSTFESTPCLQILIPPPALQLLNPPPALQLLIPSLLMVTEREASLRMTKQEIPKWKWCQRVVVYTLLLLGSSPSDPCLHGCLMSRACLCDVGVMGAKRWWWWNLVICNPQK